MPTAGYSGTPLWQKLGYRDGTAAWVENPPPGYAELLELPPEVSVTRLTKAKPGMEFVHLFATEANQLRRRLPQYRKALAPSGVVWACWPKRASGIKTDITEHTVREVALALGLVDLKVCAVDATWTGLKLVIRKALR